MVKKKRKVWWIVSGVLGFVVLLFVTALLVEWNSPNARLERALQEIIAEHGLELTPVDSVNWMRTSDLESWAIYEGAPINLENEERILAQLKQDCPSYIVFVKTYGMDLVTNPAPGEPNFVTYNLLSPDESASTSITITFDDKGLESEGDLRSSQISILRYGKSNPWSFLKNLWPW